jgi:hypothetical protein
MNSIIDGMEALLADAHKAKGWHWVYSEPTWTTWPMEKFGASTSSTILLIRNETPFCQLPQSLTSSGHIGVPWKCTLNFSKHCAVTTSPLRHPAKLPIRGLSSRISKRTVGTPNGKTCARSRSIGGTHDEAMKPRSFFVCESNSKGR